MRTYQTGSTSGAINLNISPGQDFQLESIRLHLSTTTGTASLITKIDSALSTAGYYDVVIDTKTLTSVRDYIYLPTRPITIDKADTLNVAWTNTGKLRYGIEVLWSLI